MAMNYVNFENARIIFRNFKGEKSKFNTSGAREFSVVINDKDIADALIAEGWNVKFLAPKEPEEDGAYILKVAVSYMYNPPKIFMVNGDTVTPIDEDTVGELDYADIAYCDLTITPYHWELNGKSGIKAYLKTMYVNVIPDTFAAKYNK